MDFNINQSYQQTSFNQTHSPLGKKLYLNVLNNGDVETFDINPILEYENIKILVPKRLSDRLEKFWGNSLGGAFQALGQAWIQSRNG